MSGYVGIPTSYTPVEYIESSGTQYIDTGVNGTWSSTLQFISKFAFTQKVSSAEQTFIGNKDTSNQGTTVYVSTNTTNLGSWCGSGTRDQIGTFTVNADNNLDITFTKPQGRNGTYNGSSFNSTTTANNYTSNTVNIAIFSSKAFQMETPAYMKLYFLKIKKDGVLVRDFIPVLGQDNVACLYDLVEGKFYYNQGSGIFTAGSATGQPVTLGSVARKVTKGYVGVNGVARKVTKGYVGVNGVARKFFPGSLTFTTLNIGSISYPHYGGMASTTDYVVHAGGRDSGSAMSNTTEFFDANGTKTTGSALNTKRILFGAATFNDRAFFCGGSTSSNWNTNSTVEYFNNSKVRSTGTSLSTSVYGSQAIANGLSYLMVCGGNVGNPLTDMVNFFNTSLTRTTNTLTLAVKAHSVGQINGYAIVAGGADNSAAKTAAQSFDSNGTKTVLAALPIAKAGAALASTEKYFFMLGGSSVSATGAGNKTVYVYDKNLVLTSAPDLSAATRNVSGSDYNKEYAIVPTTTTIIDIYDSNLTRSSISALGYSYEWGGYGRNASSIPNAMIYNNDSGTVFMVKGE